MLRFDDEKRQFSNSSESTDFRQELNESQLLLCLKNASEEEREAALLVAQQLPHDSRSSLIWKMLWQFPAEAEAAREQSRKMLQKSAVAVFSLAILALLSTVFAPFGMWSGYVAGISVIALILTTLGAVLNATNNPLFQLNGAVNNLSRLLETTDDLQMVPTVLSYLASHNPQLDAAKPLYSALTSLLKRLLPAVDSEQISAWTDEQKRMAILFVTKYEKILDETLTLQSMRLLEFIGDRPALKFVRKMASGSWVFTPVLRAKAVEILPALERRVAALEDVKLLLRASDRPNEGKELLRPVLVGSIESADELLRAVD